jgi:hypothetical protein
VNIHAEQKDSGIDARDSHLLDEHVQVLRDIGGKACSHITLSAW